MPACTCSAVRAAPAAARLAAYFACEASREPVAQAPGDRPRRTRDDRPGKRVGNIDISELVLDRLERSDNSPELLALHGVLHAAVKHRLGKPDQLGGDRTAARSNAACGSASSSRVASPGCHSTRASRRPRSIEGSGRTTTASASRTCTKSVAGSSIRNRSAHGAALTSTPGPRPTAITASPVATRGQPVPRHRATRGGQQRCPDEGLHQRLRQRRATRLDQCRQHVGRIQTEPAVGFRDHGGEHADVGEPSPQPRDPAVVGVPRCAQLCRRCGVGQQVTDRRAELQRVVVRLEPHRGHPLGRPRTRSATRLRCTSFVPA